MGACCVCVTHLVLRRQHKKQSAGGGIDTGASVSLHVTVRKLRRLAAQRVEGIVDALELGEEVADQIWTTVKHALRDPQVLLRDRHLDQVVICAVYAVCKVHNRPTKFLRIIQKMQNIVGPLTRVRPRLRVAYYPHPLLGVAYHPSAPSSWCGTPPAPSSSCGVAHYPSASCYD